MHTATYLKRSKFAVDVDGAPATFDALLPDWQRHDRLGIVVDRPYGLFGASLLIQAASLLFYEADEDRRWATKQYPEIYAFLLDGPKGQLTMLDFMPERRKEVIVPADPSTLVAAIHDRAITRLAVVDGAPSDHAYAFDEVNPALDRIVSAFAYAPTGRARDADVVVRGTGDLESNVTLSIDNDAMIHSVLTATREDIERIEPQLLEEDFDADPQAYVDYLRLREAEVSPAERRRLRAQRDALTDDDGAPTEAYRRIDVREALALLVPRG